MIGETIPNAAEYALGTLDASERRASEARFASDPAFRAEVAHWALQLTPLADSVEPAAPSAAVWDRLSASLDKVESTANVVPLRRPVATRWVVTGLSGAIAASLLAFAVLPNISGDGVAPVQPGSRTALPPPAAAAPQRTPAPRTADALPGCPNGTSPAVQTADAARDLGAKPGAASSVVTANADKNLGSVVVGGAETVTKPRLDGDNVRTASNCLPNAPGR